MIPKLGEPNCLNLKFQLNQSNHLDVQSNFVNCNCLDKGSIWVAKITRLSLCRDLSHFYVSHVPCRFFTVIVCVACWSLYGMRVDWHVRFLGKTFKNKLHAIGSIVQQFLKILSVPIPLYSMYT